MINLTLKIIRLKLYQYYINNNIQKKIVYIFIFYIKKVIRQEIIRKLINKL